jgi:hypothetical protein
MRAIWYDPQFSSISILNIFYVLLSSTFTCCYLVLSTALCYYLLLSAIIYYIQQSVVVRCNGLCSSTVCPYLLLPFTIDSSSNNIVLSYLLMLPVIYLLVSIPACFDLFLSGTACYHLPLRACPHTKRSRPTHPQPQ